MMFGKVLAFAFVLTAALLAALAAVKLVFGVPIRYVTAEPDTVAFELLRTFPPTPAMVRCRFWAGCSGPLRWPC